MTGDDPMAARFQESLGPEFVQNSKFHVNLSQEVIVITEDKLRLCLLSHASRLTAKDRWVAPVSLCITFIVVLATATFNRFILPSATWQAVFVICAVGSAIWAIFSVARAIRVDSKLDTVVNEVKRTSEQLKAGTE